MIDRVEKQRIMGVLRQTGLWAEADQYREQARQRLRDDGKGKQEAVEGAWDAMAEKFLPLAEQVKPAFQTILPDGASVNQRVVEIVLGFRLAFRPFHRVCASNIGANNARRAAVHTWPTGTSNPRTPRPLGHGPC